MVQKIVNDYCLFDMWMKYETDKIWWHVINSISVSIICEFYKEFYGTMPRIISSDKYLEMSSCVIREPV